MERLPHRPSTRGRPHQDDRRHSLWALPVHIDATRVYIASGAVIHDEIIADNGEKTNCVDDTLLWSDTVEGSYFQAVQWMDICGRN